MHGWLNLVISGGEKVDVAKLKQDIDGYVETFKFNKVISTLMEFYNKNKDVVMDKETAKELIEMFNVFAPGFNKIIT